VAPFIFEGTGGNRIFRPELEEDWRNRGIQTARIEQSVPCAESVR
jgi:hypothetical protein